MRSARLQGFAVKHHGFHRVGVNRACEFLFFGLLTDKNVDCKHVLHKLAIHFEHAESLFSRLFFGLVQSVTFLPQELACAKEGTSGLFPSYDVCPLVDEHGQVAIALDPLCVHGANDGLGSWAHDKLLFERSVANMCDKRDFGRETFHVIRFFDKITIRNKHREIRVFVSRCFETSVELFLNVFPDLVTVRANDHRAFDRAVIDKRGLENDVGVPLRKIDGHIGNLFDELILLFFCHKLLPYILLYYIYLYTIELLYRVFFLLYTFPLPL